MFELEGAVNACSKIERETRSPGAAGKEPARMPINKLTNLSTLTTDAASAYLEVAHGDELEAAMLLAVDRNVLAGFDGHPDEHEIHHALFLLRRAMGGAAPSFDALRVALRARAA